ncbi:serine/threonine-protein kinase [Streptomyces hawaiiensis]|uniref:non-specific serine/threonine protein kinase n=1 Tax=Streptomyces hawaiiensis TaxID=67305 RepID=A0A6G5RIU9_9ACTN|nr:serine/threonine-protein kinase [Streptomyces hawaiiensis]QCD57749.1 serine/threonine protein kinase [Streptomyces hawaiiensis]
MSEAERAGTSRQDTRQDNRERLLAGRYRLGKVLGRGGMGTVWRAQDETLGRTVAVKELRFPTNIDEEEKRRLITRTLREAKAIARIRNNSAVTVFDVVQEDDRPWIVMELVEGKSLAEVIREDGLLEPKRAAEVGLAVLDVLRSAHREGILHRDVKPSNVLIAEDGRVVLTDFGIAQVEGDPSITSTGMLVGAPSYISPERARGHKPGPAADLWSLGGLLYAAVEGAPPYDKGSAIATLTAVMTEPLEEPKNAGPLKDVIHGLLTKDPAQRLDDAGARAMLNSVLHARETAEPEPMDATKVVPLPAQPDRSSGKSSSSGSGSGGKRGEEAGERLRGALRSVRKAAAGSAAGGSAAAAESGAGKGSSGSAGTASAESDSGAGRAGAAGASGAQSGSVAAGAGGRSGSEAKTAAGGRSSGWPVMPPPDLPPRPVPRAPLTDVVPRRTLVIIAVVVVLAVIGTVLAIVLSGDGKDSEGASGKGGGKTVATASGSADTKGDDPDGTRTDGGETQPAPSGPASNSTPSGRASGSSGEGGSGAKGTAAESTHQGNQGYSIGLPKGWKYQSTGAAGDRFTGPDGQKLLIAWTSTPKGDPVADWKSQERYMVRAQYKKIRIEKVDYRGWNTADWEFTYTDGGTKYRTIDRGFVVDDRQGYALMYTAKAAGWDGDSRKETWRTLTKTFEPKS